MRYHFFFCSLLLGLISVATAYQPENKPHNRWSIIQYPTQNQSESIGGYANGCMEGAKALPEKGIGYTSVRRNRHRFFGQPKLIRFINQLGQSIDTHYQRQLLIGDMSQPRGGKMNFGHSSHQTGLDVDVWIQSESKFKKISPYRDMKSIVNKAAGVIRGNRLENPIRDALFFASKHKDVARIFVNPVIKKYLCETEKNTEWLNKIRPWWGHDQHFHVRLTCPDNSYLCQNQKPVSQNDGCDDGLYGWVKKQSDIDLGIYQPKPKKRKKTPKKKRNKKQLPKACDSVRKVN